MQDMPWRCLLFAISSNAERMSRGIVLSRGHEVRPSVLVSQRHVQQQHGTHAAVVVHSLHAGSLLRVSRADVSDGSLLGGIFLRRRQLSVDSFQERIESVGELGELQGRHVLDFEERDGERRVSCGSLLSCGKSCASAMSGGYELVVGGSDEDERLRIVCEGFLLSAQRHGVGDSSVLGGVLLSVGHGRPHVCVELAVSGGIVLRGGQLFASGMRRGHVPRPTRQQRVQGVSRG